MGDWQRGTAGGLVSGAGAGTREPRVAVTLQEDGAGAHLAGGRGVPIEHPDRPALDLLSVLLGEGMSSRLFLELRERLGLCYDVHSYASHYLDTGSLTIYAAVDPKNAVKALQRAHGRAGAPARRHRRRGAGAGEGALQGAAPAANGGHAQRLRLDRRAGADDWERC